MNRRLYRSPDDRIIAGVAGGMAETYDMDPSVVRVVWALLILLTGGLLLILYIVMALVVPLRPSGVPPPWQTTEEDPPDAPVPPGAPAPPGGTTPMGAPVGRTSRGGARADTSGPVVLGVLLILIGAFFLARQFIAIDIGRLWPIAVIVLGLVLIVAALRRGPRPR